MKSFISTRISLPTRCRKNISSPGTFLLEVPLLLAKKTPISRIATKGFKLQNVQEYLNIVVEERKRHSMQKFRDLCNRAKQSATIHVGKLWFLKNETLNASLASRNR